MFKRYRKYLIALAIAVAGVVGVNAGTGAIAGLVGAIDSANALLVSSVAYTGTTVATGAIGALQGSTDSGNALKVTFGSGQQFLSLGTGSSAVINGTATVSTTSACTIADTNETVLWTYSLPAGALSANGRGVRVTAFGSFAATVNNKSAKLYFGSTLIGSLGAAVFNNTQWRMTMDVFRTGAATQVASGVSAQNTSTFTNTAAPTETMANAIVIKATGINGVAAASDICFTGAFVETIN